MSVMLAKKKKKTPTPQGVAGLTLVEKTSLEHPALQQRTRFSFRTDCEFTHSTDLLNSTQDAFLRLPLLFYVTEFVLPLVEFR